MPQTPQNRFIPVPCTGVLDESGSPVRVGGSGLTDCNNLIYERTGGWGKRSGSSLEYVPIGQGPFVNSKPTGVRWYRTSPSPVTQLVVAAQGSLWTGNDSTGNLTKIYDFQANPTKRIRFASVYDPQAHLGSGGDILIICGATTNEGFATGTMQITGMPTGLGTVTVTIDGFVVPDVNGSSSQTYSFLLTDKPTTIAQAIVQQINSCKLVVPDPTNGTTPELGEAYVTEVTHPDTNTNVAIVNIGALISGTGMNGKTFAIASSGSGIAVQAIGGTLTGGGAQTTAPLKYDGATVSGLSYQIQHGFRNCCTWHEHVWYWDDPNFQNTLFASDIDQPEGFTFMLQNGGYKVGRGDGDPSIQVAKPWGNSLAVFKTNNIYQVSGYDFQSGEYEFQIQPLVTADENAGGSGVPGPDCVNELNDALLYWDGRQFNRLAVGAFIPEPIGAPIPLTSSKLRIGKQTLVQAVAGSFQELTQLNNQYFTGTGSVEVIRPNRAYWACDTNGDGIPDTVIAYDDDASQRLGHYAWMKWSGLQVAAWIPFGNGPNAGNTDTDLPYLFFLQYNSSGVPNVYRLGGNAKFDGTNPIPWMAQTGVFTGSSPELVKNLHRLFIELQATNGALITGQALPGRSNLPGTVQSPPATFSFPASSSPTNAEAYNTLLVSIEPQLKTNAILFHFNEPGTSGAQFELLSYNCDMIEEPITP